MDGKLINVVKVGVRMTWLIGIILIGFGCQSETGNSIRTVTTEDESQAAFHDRDAAQKEYNARIAAQTGRKISAYRQVSMFGELPGVTTTNEQTGSSNGNIQQCTFATEGACFDPKVSTDGNWLVFASTQHTIKPDIYTKQIGSTAITQLTNNSAGDVQPTFSPNSKKVAFTSERTGNWDLFVIDVNGRNLQQLTDDPVPEMHPSFSPDGTKLAYSRYNAQSHQWEVWLLDLNNPAQKKFITVGLFPSFSPKENKIAYQRATQRGTQLFSIWAIDLGGGDQPSVPTELASTSNRALIDPEWSNDGKRIVYCSVQPTEPQTETSDSQLWVVDLNGQGKMPITDSATVCYSPAWGIDDRIYFCSNRGESENVWSVAFTNAQRPSPITMGTPQLETPKTASAEKTKPHAASEDVQPNHPVHIDTDDDATAGVDEE